MPLHIVNKLQRIVTYLAISYSRKNWKTSWYPTQKLNNSTLSYPKIEQQHSILPKNWREQRQSILIQAIPGKQSYLKHYYRNVDLSRLGNLCCPGFPTENARPGQKGVPICPASGNRDKKHPFVPRLVTPTGTPTGTKGAASATWLAHPFVPVGVTNPDKRSFFFLFFFSQSFFYFNYTFAFQLNLCIGIQCVWSPLIYTYIYNYLYNIYPR